MYYASFMLNDTVVICEMGNVKEDPPAGSMVAFDTHEPLTESILGRDTRIDCVVTLLCLLISGIIQTHTHARSNKRTMEVVSINWAINNELWSL